MIQRLLTWIEARPIRLAPLILAALGLYALATGFTEVAALMAVIVAVFLYSVWGPKEGGKF
jgi:hypothetical protein